MKKTSKEKVTAPAQTFVEPASTYKLTLDVSVTSPSGAVAGLEVLRRWADEGKIELTVADGKGSAGKPAAYTWPGYKPPPDNSWKSPKSRAPKKLESGNANFKSIAAVLFPSRDSLKLSMNEINDVAHLIKHHSVKNEIFITVNLNNFIDGGRRARLQSLFGIITMTPEEVVKMLQDLHGWK